MTAAGPEDDWAPHAEQFVDGHYGTLRGRVFGAVLCHGVVLYLDDPYRQLSRLFHPVGVRRPSG